MSTFQGVNHYFAKIKQGTGVKGNWGVWQLFQMVWSRKASLRSSCPHWDPNDEKGRQAKRQEHPERPVWLKGSEWHRALAEERSERWAGPVMETHVPKEWNTSVATREEWHAVAMAAGRQERWQYVGIAGSQVNSYASILPPLQF